MSATSRAPKQWCLGKSETITSVESWWQNLTYTLAQDTAFSQFLSPGVKWLPKSKSSQLRGFTDDGANVEAAKRQTAVQKVATLEMMLGQIANFCPVIAQGNIIKKSTSITQIYNTIRLHYGVHTSGAHFLDLADISLGPDERPEDLTSDLNLLSRTAYLPKTALSNTMM